LETAGGPFCRVVPYGSSDNVINTVVCLRCKYTVKWFVDGSRRSAEFVFTVDKISILDVDHFDFMNVISNACIEDLPSHKTEKIRKGRYTGCIRFYPSMRIMMSPLRRKAGD
jgi:hypothetical protein